VQCAGRPEAAASRCFDSVLHLDLAVAAFACTSPGSRRSKSAITRHQVSIAQSAIGTGQQLQSTRQPFATRLGSLERWLSEQFVNTANS